TAVAGFLLCAAALVGTALAAPEEEWETFFGDRYVSKFMRSGVTALAELTTRGYLESDASVTERLKTLPEASCTPGGKPPHILLVHDESSFDIRVAPGVRVPADYGSNFVSFDGKRRHFIAEGTGGPSWYTEYNVLAGLSARSYGRFAYFVTRIAAGRGEPGPAAGAAPLRLRNLFALSRAWRVHERRPLPEVDRHPAFHGREGDRLDPA